MNRRIFLAITSTTVALVLLSACGFHLRGSLGEANLPFKTMVVAVPDTSPLGAELKRTIRGNGTTLVTDPKLAEAILDIVSERREKVVLSLSSQGRVREYSLYYRVTFRVRDNKEKDLLAPTEVVLKRDISFNESQALSKEAEEGLLYRDMQSDLVQQILRRIVALKPR
jgi:LPS-assembly lipoprotein